jgi:hypothetical protein
VSSSAHQLTALPETAKPTVDRKAKGQSQNPEIQIAAIKQLHKVSRRLS